MALDSRTRAKLLLIGAWCSFIAAFCWFTYFSIDWAQDYGSQPAVRFIKYSLLLTLHIIAGFFCLRDRRLILAKTNAIKEESKQRPSDS